MKKLATKFGVGATFILAIGVLGACSQPESTGIPSAQGSNSSQSASSPTPDANAYADCMRDNGVAMSDPDPKTGVPAIDKSVDVNSPTVQKALDTCESLLPKGGVRGESTNVQVDEWIPFSQCMRENGLPDFPDPQPGSGGLFPNSGVDRNSPAFQKASQACASKAPNGGGN